MQHVIAGLAPAIHLLRVMDPRVKPAGDADIAEPRATALPKTHQTLFETLRMDHHGGNAWARRQQARWLRPDAERWLRPDADRWIRPDADRVVAPGSAVTDAFPALSRKYSPNQPRVPAGNPDGGQWTDGGGGTAAPMGNIGFGTLADRDDFSDLFQIAPRETDLDGVRLAGDPPIGDSPQLPSEEPPEIPQKRPTTSADRTKFMRAAASWLVRNAGLPANVFSVAISNIEWLKERIDLIEAARDEPKTLEELQFWVGKGRPGYDNHHIAEKTWAEYFGFSKSQIDDPSNLASIPRLKHYEITGWYGRPNPDFNNLSPREYLSDKSWEERRRVGLDALVLFKVLKP